MNILFKIIEAFNCLSIRRLNLVFVSSIILTPWATFGSPSLPKALTPSNMRKILQTLGPSTSSTTLSSPYPLGGWEGFEVGLSRHYIPWSNLAEVDQTVSEQKDLNYALITVGKGLFYNFDIFLSLIPMLKSESLSYFSTQLRYQLWSSENKVFHLSSSLFGGTSNLNNQLNIQNYGFDVLGTVILDKVSIFIGIGSLFSSGRFIGGDSGITESKNTDLEKLTLPHQLIGIEWPLGTFFIAAEVDRYSIPYYSLKLGYRK